MKTISDLPNDLESEILSRVPAKSLWELKTTCKRWYALFRDRKFVEKNKKKLGESVRESVLLSDLRVYAIAGGDLLQKKNASIEFTGKLTDVNGSDDLKISEIFHCDGLMLCSMTSKLVVWNPCTGQTRSIEPRTSYCYDDAYALGYNTSSCGRSYKILRRFYRQNDKKVLGEMYDLSSDSWRVLDDSFTLLGYSVNPKGVSLKGDAYFVSPRGKETDAAFLITKFDSTTETLVPLSLPFQYLHPCDKAFLSNVRDEKIALLRVLHSKGSMSIWVTNKIDDEAKDLSWRSDVALGIGFYYGNRFFESFLFDEENKVAVLTCAADLRRKYFTRIYVIDEYMNKQVYKAKTSTFDWPRIITYAPSLVHIPKSTPKRMQKKQRLISYPLK